VIYAIALGWPTEAISVQSLGAASATQPGRIEHVQLLGTEEKLRWKQNPEGLRVEMPKGYRPSTDFAAALKVSLA
jgi:alpha-L-fucosidase